jgi:imidazolonepropionase-like amidohydrolase
MFGPRILTAGRKLEGKESMWKGDLEIANEVELHQMLDLLDQYKVDFVKITENTLSGDLFLKSVKGAHNRGYKVAGHVPLDITIEEVVDAGFSSIEHATYLLRLGSDERNVVDGLRKGTITPHHANSGYIENFDQESARLGYERLAAKGVAITPTLIGGKQLAYLDEDDHKKDEFHKYLTRRFLSKYAWRIDRMSNETPEQRGQRKYRYRLTAAQLPYLQQAGVIILAGSDAAALNTYVYPALSLHEELTLFQEAGLSPLEILQAATLNAARFTGRLDSLGSIETGKIADLVILRENPLVTITNTQGIQAVVRSGQYFDRHDLDSMLLAAAEQRIKLDSMRQD